MLKKVLVVFLALAILMSCANFALADELRGQTDHVDFVIVVDESNSMSGEHGINTKNDGNALRHDATQIVLSMISLENSRFGVILYHKDTNVDRYQKDGFQYITLYNTLFDSTDKTMRKRLIERIGELPADITSGGTYIGYALNAAVDLLLKHKNDGRAKAILLISDGASDDSVTEAIKKAKANGIKIYTVVLYEGGKRTDDGLLDKITKETNAWEKAAEARKASDLPGYFNSIFASQIGSEVKDVKAGDVQSIPGSSKKIIAIHVPNNSVTEINIVVKTKNDAGNEIIKKDSIKFFDPKGNKMEVDDNKIYSYNTNYFKTFKIVEPPVDEGSKTMYFTFEGGNLNESDINIQYVYSYSVDTVVSITSVDKDSRQRKNDPLTVEAWFVKEDGAKSRDVNLYTSIKAFLDIYKDGTDDAPMATLTMIPASDDGKSKNYSKYSIILDLREVLGENYSSGGYKAKVRFEEAGMKRSNEKSFTLTNDPPQQIKTFPKYKFYFGGEDITAPVTIDLKDYYRDPNGDEPIFELAADFPGKEKLEVSLKGSKLTIGQKSGKKGADAAGSVTIPITVHDYENAIVRGEISVEVISELDEFARNSIKLEAENAREDSGGFIQLDKGQTIKLTVTPWQDDIDAQADKKIEDVRISYTITYKDGTKSSKATSISCTEEDGVYAGSFTAGTEAATYRFHAAAVFGKGNENKREVSDDLDAKVINHPVQTNGEWEKENGPAAILVQSKGGWLATTFKFFPFSYPPSGNIFWVEPWIMDDVPEEFAFDAADYFTDADGANDTLTYTVRLDGSEDSLPLTDKSKVVLRGEDLTKRWHTLTVYCTDNDDCEAYETIDFVVWSLHDAELHNGIILILAFITLVVAFTAWYNLSYKPSYPKGAKLQMRIRAYGIGAPRDLPEKRSKMKSRCSLSRYFVHEGKSREMLADKITDNMLTLVDLYPTTKGRGKPWGRGRKVCVMLSKNKRAQKYAKDIEVSAGGQFLSYDKGGTMKAYIEFGDSIRIVSQKDKKCSVSFELMHDKSKGK